MLNSEMWLIPKKIPIKKFNSINSSIPIICDYIATIKPDNSLTLDFFKHLANSIAYELYFPLELKLANKEILSLLGDIKPISKEMNEEERIAIIQSEFERLYDPSHPIRNNLETLDSVEEVRIIKEALK